MEDGSGLCAILHLCTSASKHVEKCRFWRVMYTFLLRVCIISYVANANGEPERPGTFFVG